jgi:5-methyltetrahydrofolate--homocysteine methyltransferase
MSIIDDIRTAVFDGEEDLIHDMVTKALGDGQTADDIMHKALIEGLTLTGNAFEKGKKFIPEMLMSSEAMKIGMNILNPILKGEGGSDEPFGIAVMATIEGDVHDIGVGLVCTMMESANFKVRNMGPDVPVEDIIAAVKEDKPQIVGLSALLSNTMDIMPDVIDGLKKEGLRDSVKVMVGGAPVKQDFCDEIGADGWAFDAASAVPKAKELRGMLP